MLAIWVTEAMPDQELFSILHPGPPKLSFPKGKRRQACREQCWPFLRGILCQHLNRSSQVFAILAAIFPGQAGWTCYTLAIVQYLIIGLVTSKDKVLNVLSEFDRQVEKRRQWLIDELQQPDVEDDWLPVGDVVVTSVAPPLQVGAPATISQVAGRPQSAEEAGAASLAPD
jgi:hypothetical protein